jgi:hypothetical protein
MAHPARLSRPRRLAPGFVPARGRPTIDPRPSAAAPIWVPGAVADLHVLADYLGNLARLAADPFPLADHYLVRQPHRLAREVAQLANDLEGLKETAKP